jgi:diaminohydroxyphosphoribosylaminopyrimidine deaminase/5-amino-6-(5-phosphoribosylamino)uracil reductase
MDLKLPTSLKIFNAKQRTVIFNKIKHEEKDHLIYYQVTEDVSLVHQIVNALYQMKIQSVIVEGGTRLLQSFIDEEMWDEARIIKNEELIINRGLAAPELDIKNADEEIKLLDDSIKIYNHELG